MPMGVCDVCDDSCIIRGMSINLYIWLELIVFTWHCFALFLSGAGKNLLVVFWVSASDWDETTNHIITTLCTDKKYQTFHWQTTCNNNIPLISRCSFISKNVKDSSIMLLQTNFKIMWPFHATLFLLCYLYIQNSWQPAAWNMALLQVKLHPIWLWC